MSNRIKIELIASLLHSKSHEVEIISQGEVVDYSWTFYRSFSEPERFDSQIPIYYGSVLPIRRLTGLWSNARTLHIFKKRHKVKPYDLVIVFNMKGPQIACARHAVGSYRIPVILEYEDDAFVNVGGERDDSFSSKRSAKAASQLLPSVSGCMAVSPHLLSQVSSDVPKLLLRGVVGADVVKASEELSNRKEKIVLFSGTHTPSNGVGELIKAWPEVRARVPDWELHITGYGRLTEELRKSAEGVKGITFHGLVSRTDLVRLMCSAAICINPHLVSQAPGNVFAFKIIEYIAAGAHVVTTPMGVLEKEIESGITYMPNNDPGTIAATLVNIIQTRGWERYARKYVEQVYGPEAVARSLDNLLQQVVRA
jgi:glycosyltransferase involved in cell wall biosynthesis